MNELDILRAIGAGEWAPPSPQRRMARARLDALIQHETDRQAEPATSLIGRRQRRRVAVLAAAALLAASWVLVSMLLPAGVGGPDRAVAERLERLAQVAATQPSQATSTDAVLYRSSRGSLVNEAEDLSGGVLWRYRVPVRTEIWRAPDGSGLLLERTGEPSFLSPADEAAWRAAGEPSTSSSVGVRRERFEPGDMSTRDFTDLPTGPGAIAESIRSRELMDAPPGPAYDLDIAAEILERSWLTADVRAAVFRAMADLEGVRYLGSTVDHAGRSGAAFAATQAGRTTVLIFDPTSSALLERQTMRDGHESWTTYLRSDVVAEVGERP